MSIDRIVLAVAGVLTVLSAALATLHSPWWLALAVFVGLNQLQASFTRQCPLVFLLRRLGVPEGVAFCGRSA